MSRNYYVKLLVGTLAKSVWYFCSRDRALNSSYSLKEEPCIQSSVWASWGGDILLSWTEYKLSRVLTLTVIVWARKFLSCGIAEYINNSHPLLWNKLVINRLGINLHSHRYSILHYNILRSVPLSQSNRHCCSVSSCVVYLSWLNLTNYRSH